MGNTEKVRFNIPWILVISVVIGALFTVAFLFAWGAYLWGDGDEGRVVVCSALEVFAGPLLVGAILALRWNRAGLSLLRFGSVLYICQPDAILDVWMLGTNPVYLSYLSNRLEKRRWED